MTPDKVQQLGNDLVCLAASISEIAEELKAMYDFDHDDGYDESGPQEEAPKPEPPNLDLPVHLSDANMLQNPVFVSTSGIHFQC